jgi:hypothetical protein
MVVFGRLIRRLGPTLSGRISNQFLMACVWRARDASKADRRASVSSAG